MPGVATANAELSAEPAGPKQPPSSSPSEAPTKAPTKAARKRHVGTLRPSLSFTFTGLIYVAMLLFMGVAAMNTQTASLFIIFGFEI